MKNAVIAALVVALAVSIAAGVIARATRTVNVEVRVWQDVDDAGALWLSARPDGGSWSDLGTIPVPLGDGLSGRGRYRYGDVVIALSVPPPPSCAEPSLAADCAVLLAARDALAGDGALNWSAAVPLTEWEGVTVSGTPRRVTGLDLRNRGLTGTIPPELGSLPPTLATVYLAGNALTGCVPERLRLAVANDLETLTMERRIWYCPVPEMPSGTMLSPGTYQIGGLDDPEGALVDIPEGGPRIALTRRLLGESGISNCFTTLVGENRLCLAEVIGLEVLRRVDPEFTEDGKKAVNDLFDAIAATARRAPPPPPSCAEPLLADACAVLLAARDMLAGDGALNWSADLPLTEWDGVTVSGTPRRVTGLDLRDRGLTGTIPSELGSLPPTLTTVHLAGNAFTGCVSERLRLARWNDIETLRKERGLPWCPVPAMPSGGVALAGGTYQVKDTFIVDIPASGPRLKFKSTIYSDSDSDTESGIAHCFTDLAEQEGLCLDAYLLTPSRFRPDGAAPGAEDASEISAVFDQIVATARLAPPPPSSCAESLLAADCAVLLAARDALAGDGTLNWSANVPITKWEGVHVSWSSRRVEGLYLRSRGLTGTIPPELGSLPPTLTTLRLAGNAFTGCIPERLRLADNDLDALTAERRIWYCPVPEMPWGAAPAGGTYEVEEIIIIDIPVDGPRVQLSGVELWEGEDGGGAGYCLSDLAELEKLCLSVEGDGLTAGRGPYGAGGGADSGAVAPAGLDDVFDAIVATARLVPPLSCWEESLVPDCAILLAARDVLAGDGALNWSADVPVEDWVGVTVSGTPRRVRGLHLGMYGLTGTIPPELGNLALREIWLSGNAFTGCVPERLRLAVANDLETLMAERGLPWCPVATMPSSTILSAGTYQFDDREGEGAIVDIPEGGPQIALTRQMLDDTGISNCFTTVVGENRLCLDELSGVESLRWIDSGFTDDGKKAVNDLFDAIAASARRAPP